MFFYPGIKIAELLNIPCVRQFSQPAWNKHTMLEATCFFKLSCQVMDKQVLGKTKATVMGLSNPSLIEAEVHDQPDLNVV